MEVDKDNVLANTGATTSVMVALHPLVIMNVSEHWTRTKAQRDGNAQQVVGALLGKQNGRSLELLNSFELRFDLIEGATVIDKDFFKTRWAQYKETFSEIDFIGWYSTGSKADKNDVAIHRQMCEIEESPIFLKMTPTTSPSDKLPIFIYESVIDMVDGEASLLFVQIPYTLATEEAERIGVDHVARITPSTNVAVSSATKTLMNQYGAVKMLIQRLNVIMEWIDAVQEGKLEKNDGIMREIAAITTRLPIMDSPEFSQEFHNQCNDIALMAYLGALTKCYGNLNQLVSKMAVINDRHGGSSATIRRGRGLLM